MSWPTLPQLGRALGRLLAHPERRLSTPGIAFTPAWIEAQLMGHNLYRSLTSRLPVNLAEARAWRSERSLEPVEDGLRHLFG